MIDWKSSLNLFSNVLYFRFGVFNRKRFIDQYYFLSFNRKYYFQMFYISDLEYSIEKDCTNCSVQPIVSADLHFNCLTIVSNVLYFRFGVFNRKRQHKLQRAAHRFNLLACLRGGSAVHQLARAGSVQTWQTAGALQPHCVCVQGNGW